MKTKINILFLFVLLAASLWGMAGIFVRNLGDAISEMQTVLGRAFFSALILGIIILFKDIKLFKINPRDLWIFVLDSIGSIVLFNYSYYTTMSLTSLSVAAVLLYTAPFFVVIISFLIFGKKLTVKKSIACVVAFIGCCLVSGVFDTKHNIGAKAIIFGLLTGFGYALYTIFGDILIKKGYKTLTITFYVFFFAFIGCLPLVNLGETVAALNTRTIFWLFLMALFNTVLPYILYTTGLMGIEPTVAPIIATVEPVVATIVGAVIFHEALTLGGAVGIILVLVSVIVLQYKSSNIVKITANAKINLSLDITGKRTDGYHLIDTIMQSVTLFDRLTVKKAKDIKVICSDNALSGENNIAFKAAKLFFKETEISSGAHIYINKQIPAAAGLGGGSADAAAVLLALDSIYKTQLEYEKLCQIGLQLGADVPFFIKGGTQRARGIGEELTVMKPFNAGYFVLAKQDSKPSTAQMYRVLDGKEHTYIDTDSAVKYCEENNLSELSKVMDNSFISVWDKSDLPKKLEKYSPLKVALSGSGPTWFAVFESKLKALKCEKELKKQGITAFCVKPCEKAIIFEN